jgi:glycosyltransferase involved in cell wall biosynthesis
MHILYTNFHPGDGGGHTTYLASLVRGLRGRHRLSLAAPAGSGPNRIARELGIEAFDLDFPGGLRPSAIRASARRLAHIVDSGGVDLIHVNGSRDHWIVVWAMLTRGRRRSSIVWTKHNSMMLKSNPANWLRARFFTDHAIAVSAGVARQIEASPYRAGGVTIVRHGIDIDRFNPAAGIDSRDAMRREWGAKEGNLVIGSVAGTAPYKSWTTMAEALALLDDAQRRRLTIVVAGEPPLESQRATVAALGVGGRMVFPGLAADIRPLVAALDAGFVLSTSIETLSYACREMMAMGKPVLVSDYGGLRENLSDGRDGWVVPAGDAPAVAAWLRRLLAGEFDLGRMGAAARAHAEAEFSLAKFLDETDDVYRRTLIARAGR